LEDAIEHMEKIQRETAMTARDIQGNIDDNMETLDSLLSITSADISEIRLMVDALLEVWIGKLTLYLSS
jgi:Mg2+ and Co2+ transporter CorA